MRRGKGFWISIASIAMLLVAMLVFANFTQDASAGPAVYGDASQANVRAMVSVDGNSKVTRIVYFKTGSHATGGANTPVPSGTYCNVAGDLHYAELRFTGTLTGSAPTLVIKWQNSVDGGTTWTDVGSWTTINATTTPANQKNTVADQKGQSYFNGTTVATVAPTIYGDCWRATYTMGAGGAGSFTLIGAEK